MGDNTTSTCGYNDYVGYAGISVSVFVICESVLSIVTIYRTRDLHTNQYIFLASLAVADIILSISFLATDGIRVARLNSFVSGIHFIENLSYGAIASSLVLASLHMAIIAVDRYIRIANPFYYIQNMTKQRTITILSFTYALCFINACIPAIVYRGSKFISCINIHQPYEYFYSNVAIIVICVIVVFGCYFKIARIAINHKKSAMCRRQQTSDIEDAVIIRENRAMVMKSVQFFVTMCGVYFILNVPPFVMACVGFYTHMSDLTIVMGAHCFPLHSVLNFVISCSMNKAFYTALKRTVADLKMCFRTCNQSSV